MGIISITNTFILSTDNYATVTAAGYLSTVQRQGYQILPTDFIDMAYAFNKATGGATLGIFTQSISNGVITLLPYTVPGLTSAHLLVGNSSNAAADVAVSGDLTLANTGAFTIVNSAVTTAKINAAAVTLAKLATGITPSDVIKFSGRITWSGSGASLTTTVSGVAATDQVIATIRSAPTQAAYIVSASTNTNQVILTLSAANTSNDAVITYIVTRAAA